MGELVAVALLAFFAYAVIPSLTVTKDLDRLYRSGLIDRYEYERRKGALFKFLRGKELLREDGRIELDRVRMKETKTPEGEEMGREIFPGIEVDPEKLGGKPVIKGTRISVESILERLAAGEREEDILEAHPHLKREDIRRALAFAAKMLSKEEFVFISEAA